MGSSSNGKIMSDGILSESFNISMLMRKAFKITYMAALSAHSLSADKFETYLTSCNKAPISN